MRFSTLLASVALPVMVAACAVFPGTSFPLEELEHTTPTGGPFTQALAREYRAFAESERLQRDWFATQHFARKGLAAAHGTTVAPEDLADWRIGDAKAVEALTSARQRLMAVLAGSAPHRVPQLSATAQVKFDCWVDQQDANWQAEEIAACHRDFSAAMDAIEAQAKMVAAMDRSTQQAQGAVVGTAVVPTPQSAATPQSAVTSQSAAAAAPQVAPTVAATAAGRSGQYQLFFDFNRDTLTHEAARTVKSIAQAAQAAGYPHLHLVGYTDLTGSVRYNMRLSLKRAERVRRALIAAGVPAAKMTAEGRGRSSPLVSTADGVREPQNRRVVAIFAG
jgi:OOP family OmpA-OmpF porin